MSSDEDNFQDNGYCGVLNEEIGDIISLIWKIDFYHEIDLLKIECSNLAAEAKTARRASISLEHCERRQPYIELLNERWQTQYRQSVAASTDILPAHRDRLSLPSSGSIAN
jgi:phage FluMu gp28-like protein